MTTAFLFSGQGSQFPGMGKALCEAHPELSSIFDTASSVLDLDLKELCWNGSEAELAQTAVSQPAIMAVSLMAFEAAKLHGLAPDAVAGHSLGEYAAMAASGMLSLEDGFTVIKARAKAMQTCAEETPGGMCAVLGKSPEEIGAACSRASGYVIPVNYNSPAQTVIAGTPEGVEEACVLLSEIGAKTIRLNVSAAFHSKLMQPAADAFYESIKNVTFKAPSVPFYSNVYGDELKDFSSMPELLARHIVSPVLFTAELEKLSAQGCVNFIECGPGKVLTGLVKKTLKGVNALNIEDAASLEKAAALNV